MNIFSFLLRYMDMIIYFLFFSCLKKKIDHDDDTKPRSKGVQYKIQVDFEDSISKTSTEEKEHSDQQKNNEAVSFDILKIKTLDQVFPIVSTIHSKKRCMGHRCIDRIKQKVTINKRTGEEKEVNIPVFKKTLKWYTYEQVFEIIQFVSYGLKSLFSMGEDSFLLNDTDDDIIYQSILKHVEKLKRTNSPTRNKKRVLSESVQDVKKSQSIDEEIDSKEKIVFFEETCMEWMILAHSCFKNQIIPVTVYSNLGENALISAMNENRAKTLFINEKKLPRFIFLKKNGKIPFIKNIVFNRNRFSTNSSEKFSDEPTILETYDLRIWSFERMKNIGRTFLRKYQQEKRLFFDDHYTVVANQRLLTSSNIFSPGKDVHASIGKSNSTPMLNEKERISEDENQNEGIKDESHKHIQKTKSDQVLFQKFSQTETQKISRDDSFISMMKNKMSKRKNINNNSKSIDPNDVALIMYTSGTSSDPKGVILTHKNILSSADSYKKVLKKVDNIEYVGYLPLSHILEFVAENHVFLTGGSVGYASIKTLVGKNCEPCGDLQAFSPTVLCGVPLIYDNMKKALNYNIASSGKIKKFLFNVGYEAKKHALERGRDTPLFNHLIFNSFKRIIGNNVELIISGAAALQKETQEFIKLCFGCDIIQGYGLTESSGSALIQRVEDGFKTECVGKPCHSCEAKLVDVESLGYIGDRGQLLLKGSNIFKGYYKRPDDTKHSFTEDGYFQTGDIAMLNKDNTYSIIDRVKNLVKLPNGEYLALEKLENIYSNSPFVSNINGIFIYADSYKTDIVALIIPQMPYLKKCVEEYNITRKEIIERHESNLEDLNEQKEMPIHNDEAKFEKMLCEDEKVKQMVMKNLVQEANKHGLNRFENIKNIKLLPDEKWTSQNGLLTMNLKKKRTEIYKKYEKEIQHLYYNLYISTTDNL